MIRITETVRDALQGLKTFVPTANKIAYIKLLLKAGFDIVDVGSFVSPVLIPQMADTTEVVSGIDNQSNTRIMALVVNTRGVQKALAYPSIKVLSYPYSVSPTFLRRNLNTSPEGALKTLKDMIMLTEGSGIEWVVYLSMALGNPYGDPWNTELLLEAAGQLYSLGIRNMPLSDILGQASPDTISKVYTTINPAFPDVDFGLHLHTKPYESFAKLEAAWEAGVRSYETVLGGLGGCPTAADDLVGNLNTLNLIAFCNDKGIATTINQDFLYEALTLMSGFPIDKQGNAK